MINGSEPSYVLVVEVYDFGQEEALDLASRIMELDKSCITRVEVRQKVMYADYQAVGSVGKASAL
ncbi:MAG TPA: hypothetical protein VNH41_10210 [Steroidobacteraceae bacterium]|nr:hypothetical protein [Steroidobacteraceae bacterium]